MYKQFNNCLLQNNTDKNDILHQKKFINYLTSALLSESSDNNINICEDDIADNIDSNITSDAVLSFKRESSSSTLFQQIIINPWSSWS